MKIISWNVNGIRAWKEKKGSLAFINSEKPHMFCLQEIKAQEDQIDENLFHDYPSRHFNSAEKKGYSGTAFFSKQSPLNVSRGIYRKNYDTEGRVITSEFETFFLICVYTPNTKPDLSRLSYRYSEWDKFFLAHLLSYEKKKPVIVCGDLNVAYQPIDLARPEANETNEKNPGSPGFTDKEREGFRAYLDAGFIDVYRYLYPKQIQYTWWSYRAGARRKNVGWRIDYFLCSPRLIEKVKEVRIYDHILGSDHCPIGLTIDL